MVQPNYWKIVDIPSCEKTPWLGLNPKHPLHCAGLLTLPLAK